MMDEMNEMDATRAEPISWRSIYALVGKSEDHLSGQIEALKIDICKVTEDHEDRLRELERGGSKTALELAVAAASAASKAAVLAATAKTADRVLILLLGLAMFVLAVLR